MAYRNWIKAFLAAVLGLALAAGCGDSTAEVAEEAADEVFAGSAVSVTGESVDLAAYADTDLVVWFWAPW